MSTTSPWFGIAMLVAFGGLGVVFAGLAMTTPVSVIDCVGSSCYTTYEYRATSAGRWTSAIGVLIIVGSLVRGWQAQQAFIAEKRAAEEPANE